MKELRVMIAISCGKDNQDIGQSTRGRDNSPWKHFQCLKSFRITNVGFPLHLKKKKKNQAFSRQRVHSCSVDP